MEQLLQVTGQAALIVLAVMPEGVRTRVWWEGERVYAAAMLLLGLLGRRLRRAFRRSLTTRTFRVA